MNTLLVAGSGAQVGKTVVMTALIAYWQRYFANRRLGIMKPIECKPASIEPDAEQLIRLFALDQSASEIAPVTLQANAAPAIAAAREGMQIQIGTIWQQLQQLQQQRDFVLLEAWGGLGAPLIDETTVADLAWDWQLPTVLVVSVQPDTLADAVANVALARQSKIHLKGIILNATQPCSQQEWADWAPADLIQALTRKPVIGCIPYLSDPLDRDALVRVAATWELERLLPNLETIALR